MSRTQSVSLPEVHGSVKISRAGWAKRLFSFFGPAYLVSVGYMDPGNWATDIEGGARFGYALIWVLLMSNLMAVLLQTLSARLGIVTGRDLAQSCRDNYPKPIAISLWILCEIAIAACDLAELLGTAIGLHLLFDIPVLYGVIITAFDTFLLLAIQNLGMRKFEAFVLSLVVVIGVCFVFELLLSKPELAQIATGFAPSLPAGALFVAIGIIGATVMPHNLYLHSALVQTREIEKSDAGKKEACKSNLIDTSVALNAAFFVNSAILILAASVFYKAGIVVNELDQAHHLLSPMLGTSLAGVAFAVALLAAGQSSTLTGTLAGQIVMEGFVNFKMRPFLRRLLTRMLALIPAVIVLSSVGEGGTYALLLLSQVILSLQLPFAIIPLIHFTSNKELMGSFVNKTWVKYLAWCSAVVIITLNINLVIEKTGEWMSTSSHPLLLGLGIGLAGTAILALLVTIAILPTIRRRQKQVEPSWRGLITSLRGATSVSQFKYIGVAIAHDDNDKHQLLHAVQLAKTNSADLLIIHVVEGAGTTLFGKKSYDAEARSDEQYMRELTDELSSESLNVTSILGYGSPSKEIVRISLESNIDLLVLGGHGHGFFADFLFGSTVSPVRHALKIPVLVVR